MVIDKNVKIGIITSIVATILFIYFIDPILTLFGKTLLRVTSSIYSSYVDHLFEKVALCSAMDQAYILLCLVMGMLAGCSLGFCSGGIIWTVMKKKEDSPKKLTNLINLSPTKTIIFGVGLVVIFNFSIVLSLWDGWFQLKTITSFQQHMKAVAPFLEEQEEKRLWSSWTQMRSRQDYDKIYTRLKTVATSHGLRLPENMAYSSASI